MDLCPHFHRLLLETNRLTSPVDQAKLLNKLYFQNFDAPARPIDRSLRANLPDWSWTTQVVPARPGNSSSWASAAFRWLLASPA